MKECLKICRSLDTSCPNTDCRNWISYESEYNCVLETVDRNDSMTLREVAKRLGVSFVRIKQIEDKALKKIGHLLDKESI